MASAALTAFEAREGTPVLDERAVGIAARFAPEAEDEPGPARLLAAWRLPASAPRELHLVGVDATTGAVRSKTLPRPHGAQALDVAVASELGLAAEDRTLAVFLWCGEHASPLVFLRHAPPMLRGRILVGWEQPGLEAAVQVDVELARRGDRLVGALHAPGRALERARPLTLVALAGRELAHWRALVPLDAGSFDEWRFEVPIAALRLRGRVHLVAIAEDVRSDVLTLEVSP